MWEAWWEAHKLEVYVGRALAAISWLLPRRAILWLGDSILSLFRYEVRIGGGPWQQGIPVRREMLLDGEAAAES